jgi:hypothetical protein
MKSLFTGRRPLLAAVSLSALLLAAGTGGAIAQNTGVNTGVGANVGVGVGVGDTRANVGTGANERASGSTTTNKSGTNGSVSGGANSNTNGNLAVNPRDSNDQRNWQPFPPSSATTSGSGTVSGGVKAK